MIYESILTRFVVSSLLLFLQFQFPVHLINASPRWGLWSHSMPPLNHQQQLRSRHVTWSPSHFTSSSTRTHSGRRGKGIWWLNICPHIKPTIIRSPRSLSLSFYTHALYDLPIFIKSNRRQLYLHAYSTSAPAFILPTRGECVLNCTSDYKLVTAIIAISYWNRHRSPTVPSQSAQFAEEQ